MTITLNDIRIASRVYMDSNISTVTTISSRDGAIINAGEIFKLEFHATHRATYFGITLKNVVYRLRVTAGRAKLLVPRFRYPTTDIPTVEYYASSSPNEILGMGWNSEQDMYYIFPVDPELTVLRPGETHSIGNIPAKALAPGGATIEVSVYADFDMDSLFPRRISTTAGILGASFTIQE